MSKLKLIYDRYNVSKEEVEKEVAEVISTIFEELPEVENIYVVGTTPSFNDGEPCTHTQSSAFNVKNLDNEEESSEDTLLDHLPDGESGACYETLETGQSEFSDTEKVSLARNVLRCISDKFYYLYGTNVHILFVRESSEVYRKFSGYADGGY